MLGYGAATNKRRNLSSWQKACAAADAVEVLARLQEAARAAQVQGGKEKVSQKFDEASDTNANRAATKVAEMFGTNREYASKAPLHPVGIP